MKTNEIIGIDVSKLTIDVCIHSVQIVKEFKNTKSGFTEMTKWVAKNTVFSYDDTLYVFENTGMYSHKLTVFLSDKNLHFSVISGLEIKRSMGITRGKDDQVDAKRIALYGYRLKDEIKPSKIPSKVLLKLKNLLSLRSKLVKQNAGYKATLKEQKRVYKVSENKEFFEVQNKMITTFKSQIKKLDTRIRAILKDDEALENTYNLVTSVKGIGQQTALMIIMYTDNFYKFENARKFASYCGIAPFAYQSGTSVKGRTKVSHLANKNLKSIINMCAISAIQHNPEMKAYYQKRVEEGKHKMSTINIIRNKLIARVFAVIKRQTPYVDVMRFAA